MSNYRNDQILVSSTSKAIKKANVYGKLDVKDIFIFKMLDYYINFTMSTINNGSDYYVELHKQLTECIRKFTYKNSDVLCNYLLTINPNLPNTTLVDDNITDNDNGDNDGSINDDDNNGDNSGGDIISDPSNSNAPSVEGIIIDISTNSEYDFKVSDFTFNFNDVDGDTYKYIIIYPANTTGVFELNGIELTDVTQLLVSEVVNLKYTRPDNNNLSTALPFRISDDSQYNAFSSVVNNTIIGAESGIDGNQPVGDVGDNTIYVDNGVTTILTLEMFTSQLKAPYNDPEGDLIDAIRLDDISNANQGVFYLNGVEVVEGTIVTREDMQNQLFTHMGPNTDSISSDTFVFVARDEGSKIWIE